MSKQFPSVLLPLILFIFLFPLGTLAQDSLSSLSVVSTGSKVYLNWSFVFTDVKQIGIQSSTDSVNFFTTVGNANNPQLTENQFVEEQPIPGHRYYRLFVLREGGFYFFSPAKLADTVSQNEMDALLKASQQKGAAKNEDIVSSSLPYQPSIFVYTNQDGNVNIVLLDAKKENYTLRFYDEEKNFLFEIPKITQSFLVLDKTNFLRAGRFHYELYRNGELFEKWKFDIPKD